MPERVRCAHGIRHRPRQRAQNRQSALQRGSARDVLPPTESQLTIPTHVEQEWWRSSSSSSSGGSQRRAAAAAPLRSLTALRAQGFLVRLAVLSQEDLDFFIGDEAEEKRKFRETWVVESPIEHGQIKNWDYIERFWQHCIFKYLKCEPEEHLFMLTEPPMNAPENRHPLPARSPAAAPHMANPAWRPAYSWPAVHREFTAEIMFETFNVKVGARTGLAKSSPCMCVCVCVCVFVRAVRSCMQPLGVAFLGAVLPVAARIHAMRRRGSAGLSCVLSAPPLYPWCLGPPVPRPSCCPTDPTRCLVVISRPHLVRVPPPCIA